MATYITHYQKDTAMQLNFKLNNYNTFGILIKNVNHSLQSVQFLQQYSCPLLHKTTCRPLQFKINAWPTLSELNSLAIANSTHLKSLTPFIHFSLVPISGLGLSRGHSQNHKICSCSHLPHHTVMSFSPFPTT